MIQASGIVLQVQCFETLDLYATSVFYRNNVERSAWGDTQKLFTILAQIIANALGKTKWIGETLAKTKGGGRLAVLTQPTTRIFQEIRTTHFRSVV